MFIFLSVAVLSHADKETMTEGAAGGADSAADYDQAMRVYEKGGWTSGSGVLKEFALDRAKGRVSQLEKESRTLRGERDHYRDKAREWKTRAVAAERRVEKVRRHLACSSCCQVLMARSSTVHTRYTVRHG